MHDEALKPYATASNPRSTLGVFGGEIMIDFKEGGRADSTRAKLLGESTDTTQIDERFSRQHHQAMKKRDCFVQTFDEDRPWFKEYTADLSSYLGEFSVVTFTTEDQMVTDFSRQ